MPASDEERVRVSVGAGKKSEVIVCAVKFI